MLKLRKNKRGIALSQAFPAILILVIVAVLVIVAIFLFSAIGTSLPAVATVGVSETMTSVNETGSVTTNATACNFAAWAVVNALNGTNGDTIPASNFTVDTNGTIAYAGIVNVQNFNNTAWIVNSTFNWGDEACIANASMITQFGTFPVLVGLVGTIIFLGLVIGILVASFTFGGGRAV